MMKVRDLMTKNVRTCNAESSLTDVAKIMSDLNCGAVPVTEGQNLVGIITDRDIVLRTIAKGQNPTGMKVADCMTRSVKTCTSDMDVHEAADLMSNSQIRRLPVVDNGKLCGIVALGDLATINIHVDEAGQALSDISTPSQPRAH